MKKVRLTIFFVKVFTILVIIYFFYNYSISLFYFCFQIDESLTILNNSNLSNVSEKNFFNNNYFNDISNNKEIAKNAKLIATDNSTNKVHENASELLKRRQSLFKERWPFLKPLHPDEKRDYSPLHLWLKNYWVDLEKEIFKYEKSFKDYLFKLKQEPTPSILKRGEKLSLLEKEAFGKFLERFNKNKDIGNHFSFFLKEIPIQQNFIKVKNILESANAVIWKYSKIPFIVILAGLSLGVAIRPFKHIIFFSKYWSLSAEDVLVNFNYYLKSKKRNVQYRKLSDECINELKRVKSLDINKLDSINDWKFLLQKLSEFIFFCQSDKEIRQDISNGQFILYDTLKEFIVYSSRIHIYINFFKKWKVIALFFSLSKFNTYRKSEIVKKDTNFTLKSDESTKNDFSCPDTAKKENVSSSKVK